ncbi:HD domain-containing phosphohydrolase [Massilia sp. CFBP9026]|uniref:HD domain-containing phosphohydrolase n=1 Tax=Massilia sp. CFBP9026 TaxID=3096536 RepID=UPI002A6A1FDD|nr:HD domain-containing phosphohydrolase [Massilia sp. CFBP9026]MDY0962548.1 LuxR C-terminal-related transcriptional regulator [Massilia sp. CFBP9026]
MDTAAREPSSSLSLPAAWLHGHDTATLSQAMGLLAIVGDLSMGQPIDGSERAARLAARVAAAAGANAAACEHARMVALLRWSGCTANAAGFAAMMGDDVGARHALVSRTLNTQQIARLRDTTELAEVHCEVAGDIAAMMGLPAAVESGLRHVWENYDGSGLPFHLRGDEVPTVVYHAALGGDLEILARVHGIDRALEMIAQLGDVKYPARLVALVAPHARAWLDELEADEAPSSQADFLPVSVPLTLVSDMIELKLPWLAGYSRRVALLAQEAAQLAGLPEAQQRSLARAALLHGIGRAAVTNTVWERSGKLSAADWEAVRLVPYWTARAGSRIDGLGPDAQLASHVYERLDGSGYFRSLDASALGAPQRLLGVAAALVALRSPRPWRAPHEPAAAGALLAAQVTGGRFDRVMVDAVMAAATGVRTATVNGTRDAGANGGGSANGSAGAPVRATLSAREAEVLQRISLGESNKEAARAMRISPSTVRTHVESIFRKLDCSTRAAATLKALTLGLI